MKTVFAISLLLSSLFSFSQFGDGDKNGQLGLLGGWNYANIKASGLQTKNHNGFYAGVLWEHKIVPLVRVQSGLLFVQNGYSLEGIPNADFTTLNYLQLPVIAKLKLGPVYALGGITSALRVGGATNFADGTSEKVSSDDYKSYDFGAQVGLGFQFLIIGIEARYTWGLTNIAQQGVAVNNQAFSVGAHLHLL